MELNLKERLLLLNQYRILEALYPNEAEIYQGFQKILREGYELDYAIIASVIVTDTEDVMPVEACREVLEILEMYGSLQRADPKKVFPGFDGNHEGRYMGYAQFLRSKGDFTDVKVRSDNCNSHSSLLPYYRAALRAWKKSDKKHELTPEDIERIDTAYVKEHE